MVSSTPCHRPRRRPGPPPSQVGIWITDLMLQQAIGQFQRRSLVTNRSMGSHKVLSVSGRRPVGKRQLTDAMASSQYQPLWWFELMGNKNAWQWQAPSTTQERREKEKHVTWSSSLDKVVAWLEASDLDKPFLDPPADAMGQQAINAADTVKGIAEKVRADSAQITPETLASHIEHLGNAIASFSALDGEALSTAATDCCKALEYRILSAQFTEFELDAALAALRTSVLESSLPRDLLDNMSQLVLGTIIRAVCSLCPQKSADCEVANTVDELGELYSRSMSAILQRIHTESGSLQEFMVSQLLKNLQPADTFVTPILLSIVQDIVGGFAGQHFGPSGYVKIQAAWTSRLIELSDTLCQLPEHMRQKIAAHMKDVLFAHASQRFDLRPAAFSWLFIATRGGFYSGAEHAELVKEFRRRYGGVLRTPEVISLIMENLVGLQVLDEEQRLSVVSRLEGIEYLPFYWVTLLDSFDRKAWKYDRWVLKEVMACLSGWGETRRLHFAVVATQLSSDHQHLADRARDMMRVYLTAKEFRRRRCLTEVSKISHWLRSHAHLRRQLKDPEDKISPYLDWKRIPQVIEEIAIFYASHRSVTDRQAQRGIEWCLTQSELYSENHVGSERILQALTEVLIRQLEQGQPMDKNRMSYLLKKIKQYQGAEEATKVRKRLEDWSKYVVAHNRVKACSQAKTRQGIKP